MRPLLHRRLLLPVYVGYLLVVLYLVLSPQPDAASTGVGAVSSVLRRLGFAGAVEVDVEVGLNVLLFVPLGLLGVLIWRRTRWWWWGPIGLAFSMFLEAFQWAFLPNRSATATDLVANTTGALAGAVAGVVLLRELQATWNGIASEPPLLHRRHAVGIGVVLLVGVALMVLMPTGELPGLVVRAVPGALEVLGAPPWLTSVRLWDRLLNVLLFVPFGVLAALIRPGWSKVRWGVVGLAGSLAIELTQGFLLPNRDGQLTDLVTNTAGMVLGAALAHGALRRLRSRTAAR